MRVLVVNAGSSSLKLTLLGDGSRQPLAQRELAAGGDRVDARELAQALADGPLAEADAVGHRIVHGGERFTAAVLIDAQVRRALHELADLAPLHQEKSLAALRDVSAHMSHVPAVACFDTAFHAQMPPAAHTYALPLRWRQRWAIRRYGFHGLSHAWVARRVGEMVGERAGGRPLRIVSCHLGAGASLCAIAGDRSIDTTMGFTPLEGLTMATRSGSVDPGLLLWLMQQRGLAARDLAHALEHESGLIGLGGSADMREIIAGADAGRERERLALDVYVHRLRAGVAAMAAALGGIDVLAFTGGVGERSPEIRRLAADGLGFLGVTVEAAVNDARRRPDEDAEITADGARVRTLVVHAREDLEIARQVRGVLAPGR